MKVYTRILLIVLGFLSVAAPAHAAVWAKPVQLKCYEAKRFQAFLADERKESLQSVAETTVNGISAKVYRGPKSWTITVLVKGDERMPTVECLIAGGDSWQDISH